LFAQESTSKKLARYALQSYLALVSSEQNSTLINAENSEFFYLKTKGKKVRNLPLIISVPLNEGTTLITGVPPYRSINNTEK
jgi:hypothetical protein